MNEHNLDQIIDYLEITDKKQLMDTDPSKYYQLRLEEQKLVGLMLEEENEDSAVLMHVYLEEENYSAARDLLEPVLNDYQED